MVKPRVLIVPAVRVLFTLELSFSLGRRKRKHILNEIFDTSYLSISTFPPSYPSCADAFCRPYLWVNLTNGEWRERKQTTRGRRTKFKEREIKIPPPKKKTTEKLISSKLMMIGSCFVIKAIKASVFLLQSLYCLTYSWDFVHLGFNFGSPSVSSAFPPVWLPPWPDVWRLCLPTADRPGISLFLFGSRAPRSQTQLNPPPHNFLIPALNWKRCWGFKEQIISWLMKPLGLTSAVHRCRY